MTSDENASASDTARVDLVDVVLHVTPSSPSACVDDTITYTYLIENLGSASISDLSLNDDKFGEIELDNSSLEGYDSIVVKVPQIMKKSGFLNNTATLKYSDPDGRQGEISRASSVNVNCLIFSKKASVKSADVGQTIIYSYTLVNRLDQKISDLEVSDNLIPGPVKMNRTELLSQEAAEGTARYIVKPEDLPGPLINEADFIAYDQLNNTLIGHDNASVELNYSDLQITKNSPNSQVALGDLVEYDIRVTNNGPSLARDVKVQDILPAGCIFYYSEPSGYDPSTNIWSIGDLAKGQSSGIRLITKSVSVGKLINSARVYARMFDPVPENNESTSVTFVEPPGGIILCNNCCGNYCDNCCNCPGNLTNYINVSNDGKSIQFLAIGSADIRNISQEMNGSANNYPIFRTLDS